MRLPVLLLLLLLPTAVWAQPAAFHPAPRTPVAIFVAPTGSDAVACAQATNVSTPRKTVNGGIGCLAPGGVLDIAPGVYNELLSGQFNAGQTTCQADLAAIQSPCGVIPSGLSESQPTVLRGAGGVVISPVGTSFPGGGGILTLGAASRYLRFDSLGFIMDTAPGSATGIVFGDAQYVTLTRSEVDGGTVNASAGSRFLTITHNDLHHAGRGCDNQVQRTPPCPHCAYVRGQDTTISHNLVRYCADYGLQASSEHGGLARITIERNIVVGNPGTGIRCAAEGCVITANLLYQNGTQIAYGGSNVTIANNTLIGRHAKAADPWGIFGPRGRAQVINNLIYGAKSSWHAIIYDDFSAPDPAMVHHNMSEWPLGGNAGLTLSAPAETVFADYAAQDYTLKAGSAALGKGSAVPEGTTDIQGQRYGTPPDLGADSVSQQAPPIPPQPPAGATRVTCEGLLGSSAGALVLLCQPQPAAAR